MHRIYLFILLFLSATALCAQADLPRADLRVPFDFPLFLSGNFGELRSNHFHGGLDFKTQGVEGKPLHCPADGYISRVSVSPGGYGNAIYITHNNGYTTVHGHLQRFLPKVAALVREHQYKYETYALDTLLTPDCFPVERGQVVAWAGNSGYSFGPHLHMEVRLTETNEPVDPLIFYKDKLKDTRPPRAHRIMVYPMKGRGVVEGEGEKRSFTFAEGNRLAKPVTAWGEVGIGISANDYMDDTRNSYGVHSVCLLADGVEVFSSLVDRFSFDENRMINSWADYGEYHARKRWYMKSFVAPGNPLRMLRAGGEGRGIITVSEERPYKLEYILSDRYGNTSRYTLELMGVRSTIDQPATKANASLKWDKDSQASHCCGFELSVPKGMLYEDVSLHIKATPDAYAYSAVYSLGDELVPLHGYCPLAIKVWPEEACSPDPLQVGHEMLGNSYQPWPTLPPPYAKKLYIVQRREGWTGSVGGRYEDGWVKTNVRELGGDFYVSIDTVPPTIEPLAPAEWDRKGIVRLKIGDSQTGISRYRATLDGRWTLMEYSSKNRQLTLRLSDSPLTKDGSLHDLQVTVTDGVGNTTTLEEKVRY